MYKRELQLWATYALESILSHPVHLHVSLHPLCKHIALRMWRESVAVLPPQQGLLRAQGARRWHRSQTHAGGGIITGWPLSGFMREREIISPDSSGGKLLFRLESEMATLCRNSFPCVSNNLSLGLFVPSGRGGVVFLCAHRLKSGIMVELVHTVQTLRNCGFALTALCLLRCMLHYRSID